MNIEYSESKRREVFAQRRIDLLRAARIFEGDVVTSVDDRHDYGEIRQVSIGMVSDDCYVVVLTQRAHATG